MKDDIEKYLNSFQSDFNHFLKGDNKDIILAATLISKCLNKNKKLFKSHRRVHNENYNILENNEGDNIDQKNYNTEEHHKRQHKF